MLIREKDVAFVLEALTALTDGRIETMLAQEMYYPWDTQMDETIE